MGKKQEGPPPGLMCHCLRCGKWWMKRVEGRPVRCPQCKEHDWDVPAGVKPLGRPKAAKGKK